MPKATAIPEGTQQEEEGTRQGGGHPRNHGTPAVPRQKTSASPPKDEEDNQHGAKSPRHTTATEEDPHAQEGSPTQTEPITHGSTPPDVPHSPSKSDPLHKLGTHEGGALSRRSTGGGLASLRDILATKHRQALRRRSEALLEEQQRRLRELDQEEDMEEEDKHKH